MKKDDYLEKIKILNEAWNLINRGLNKIKEAFPKDLEVEYFHYRISQGNIKLHQYLIKKFEQMRVDEEFEKLVQKLKKKTENE